MTFRWITPPNVLADNIERYGQDVLVKVHAVATRWGQMVQDRGRQTAPWTDRTGNARSGLFFAVDGFDMPTIVGEIKPGMSSSAGSAELASVSGDKNRLVITFGHTEWYGKFLELSHGGRWAIIMSTLEGNLPALERMLKDLFR